MKIQVAILQFDVKTGNVEHNMQKAEQMMVKAAKDGAQLLVLPELWNCGFAYDRINELAQDVSGEAVSLMRAVASDYKVMVVGGSIVENRHNKLYNTSFVLDQKGKILCKYRKAHIFSHLDHKEGDYFSPGDEWGLCDYTQNGDAISLGLSICYDLRFPEFYRNMALRGARIFTVPAAWPGSRKKNLELFARARAAENRAFVLVANCSDDKQNYYTGGSMVIDPDGNIVTSADKGERILSAEIDTDLLKSPYMFDTLQDRQAFLDEIDNNLI